MAMGAEYEPIGEDVVNLFACMVVLIAGCWVELPVLVEGGLRFFRWFLR